MDERTDTPLLSPCPKCGQNWGNPTIRHDKAEVVFFIQCGNCRHESASVNLRPAIENWNSELKQA